MSRQLTVRAPGATVAMINGLAPRIDDGDVEEQSPSDSSTTALSPLSSPKLEEVLNKKIDMKHLASRMEKVNVLVLRCDGTYEYGLSQGRDDLLAAARSEEEHFKAYLASPVVKDVHKADREAARNVVHNAESNEFDDSPPVLSPSAFSRTRSGSVTRTRRPTHHPTTTFRDIRKLFSHATMSSDDIADHVTMTSQKIAAIVTVHKCTIIMPPGADSLLSSFTEKLKASLAEADAIPFEFRAIEGVLETVCEMYHKQVATFDEYAHSLSDNLSDKKRLYWLKRSVLEVNTQADATLNVLNEVLENDMDMAMMYLTKLYLEPDHLLDLDLPQQHEEMETMLETYLDAMRGACNRLQLMLRELEIREDELELSLDERRNKLLFADIVLSLAAVILAFVAAVAGLFGMNLTSGLENDPNAFSSVSITMLVVSMASVVAVSIAFKYTLG